MPYTDEMLLYGIYKPASMIIDSTWGYWDSLGTYFDSTSGKEIIYFDTAGNQIKHEYFRDDGSLHSVQKWTYDDNGRRIEYHWDKGSPTYDQFGSFAYNNKGLLVEEKYYNSDDSLVNIKHNQYDSTGRLIEIITDSHYECTGMEVQNSRQYFYNSGRKITREIYKSEYGNWDHSYYFSSEQDTIIEYPTSSIEISGDTTVLSYFDDANSWTYKEVRSSPVKNKQYVRITKRIITYHRP